MLDFARLPARERAAIFDEVGSCRGIGSHIIEALGTVGGFAGLMVNGYHGIKLRQDNVLR